MTAIDTARLVVTEGVHVFRPRKDAPGEYDVKPYFCGRKGSDWVALDAFSASAIVQVYDALNEANRAKFAQLSIQRMAAVAFKFVR